MHFCDDILAQKGLNNSYSIMFLHFGGNIFSFLDMKFIPFERKAYFMQSLLDAKSENVHFWTFRLRFLFFGTKIHLLSLKIAVQKIGKLREISTDFGQMSHLIS
jgi:hypothetical protein